MKSSEILTLVIGVGIVGAIVYVIYMFASGKWKLPDLSKLFNFDLSGLNLPSTNQNVADFNAWLKANNASNLGEAITNMVTPIQKAEATTYANVVTPDMTSQKVSTQDIANISNTAGLNPQITKTNYLPPQYMEAGYLKNYNNFIAKCTAKEMANLIVEQYIAHLNWSTATTQAEALLAKKYGVTVNDVQNRMADLNVQNMVQSLATQKGLPV